MSSYFIAGVSLVFAYLRCLVNEVRGWKTQTTDRSIDVVCALIGDIHTRQIRGHATILLRAAAPDDERFDRRLGARRLPLPDSDLPAVLLRKCVDVFAVRQTGF